MISVKIFVGYHKPAFLLKNDTLKPILLGALQRDSETKEFFKDCFQDGYGDNISDKNSKYCELTGLYNIWKNPDFYTSNVDYIGFMHYRRILNFGGSFNKIRLSWYSNYMKRYINRNKIDLIVPKKSLIFSKWVESDNKLHKLGLSKKPITKITKESNISMREHYEAVHIKEDFDCMLEGIKSLYPEIYKVAKNSVNLKEAYFFNMFIAKKEIFNDMMTFIFSVLDFISKERNEWTGKEYNHPYQNRVAGFISERLVSIYINYLYSKKSFNIKEKKMLMIEEKPNKLIYKIFGFLK